MTNTAEINVNTLYLTGASNAQINSWAHEAYENHDDEKLALALLATMPRMYSYVVFRCSNRMDWAMDAVDTAKIKILMNFYKSDVTKHFIGWCCRIAYYSFIDDRRAMKGYKEIVSLDETGFGDDGQDSRMSLIEDTKALTPEEEARKNARAEEITGFFQKLGTEEKEVWTKHFVMHKTIAEIADETGRKPSRVRYLLYNANDYMKAKIRETE